MQSIKLSRVNSWDFLHSLDFCDQHFTTSKAGSTAIGKHTNAENNISPILELKQDYRLKIQGLG